MEKDSVFDGASAMNRVAVACHFVIVAVLEPVSYTHLTLPTTSRV